MAHMWFGDLVTMRWWDDLWLNESFATFMAVHAQVNATRWRDAWVTFLDAEKAWAKVQDDLPSTHPVADEMPDVESVHQNFDGITYAKGASVLRQLVAWVGEDAFLAGCRAYFARHAWGNTVLADFLAALESASGRDLGSWRDEWLRTTGINRLAPEVEVDDEGRFTAFRIVQTDPAPPWRTEERAPILRSHRIAIGLYRDRAGRLVRDERIEIDVQGALTPVDALIGVDRPDLIVVNDDDLTFAKVSLDDVSLATVLGGLRRIDAAMPRALVWTNAWDMVRDAQLPARSFVALVVGNVGAESDIGVLQRLLMRATAAAERFADPEARAGLRSLLVHHAREALDGSTPGGERQLAFVRHWAWLADAEPVELAHLRALIDGEASLPGLVLDADLRWHLVTCLAHAGVLDDGAIDAELARDDTDLGRRQAATARAARPDAGAKEAAWEVLGDVDLSLTMSRHVWGGFVQLDQADVLAPYVDRYFDALDAVWERRSLDWALEWSAGMFPHPLAGPGLLARTDATLAREDLPRPLRRVLLEQRDGLTRVLRARACDRDASRSDPTG
jgi:aminopeptidase N